MLLSLNGSSRSCNKHCPFMMKEDHQMFSTPIITNANMLKLESKNVCNSFHGFHSLCWFIFPSSNRTNNQSDCQMHRNSKQETFFRTTSVSISVSLIVFFFWYFRLSVFFSNRAMFYVSICLVSMIAKGLSCCHPKLSAWWLLRAAYQNSNWLRREFHILVLKIAQWLREWQLQNSFFLYCRALFSLDAPYS